jgi:hypothetical protein
MLVLLAMISFSFLVAAQPPLPPGAPNARVAGRVVDADTSGPVSGAVVMLVPVAQWFSPVAMAPPQAVTDATGEFAVQRVWAARYHVQIQKTGFAPLSDLTDAAVLDVNSGQTITGLAFALKKGSVIAGRIVDATGEPRRETTVAALRSPSSGDERTPGAGRTSRMAQTDDRGEFRLADLAEGRYVVIATPGPRPPFATSQPAGGTVLAPTFYPGTADREAAHVIDLGAAQTVDGIQFSLVALPAHQISGVVVDEAGSPQAGVMLALMGGPGVGSMTPAMAQTDQAGKFSIGGVVAGTYRVTAMIPRAIGFLGGAGANAGRASGAGSVQGGVVGGIAVAVPVGGIQTRGLPSTEVTVDANDVTGVRIVVPARNP